MDYNIDTLLASSASRARVVIGKRPTGPVDAEGKTVFTDVGFMVVGTSSDEYAKVAREIELLNVQQAAMREKSGDGKASDMDLTTPEAAGQIVDQNALRRHMVACACVVDWFGFVDATGEAAVFDPLKIDSLLKIKPLWVRMIVNKVEDDENFTEG